MTASLSNPILHDLPEKLASQRLVLRPPHAGDGHMVWEAIMESLTDLRRFPASLPWAVGEQTVESSEVFCRTSHANYLARKDLVFLLLERSTGQLVGVAGLHRPNWSVPKFEVGYWGRSSTSGRGYVSEGVNTLAKFALTTLGAARLDLHTDEANQASRAVAERCQFQLEGILRNFNRSTNGELRNHCIYARLVP